MTKDEIEDRFDSISFRPPKTFSEMKAWHHFSKYDGSPLNIEEVFRIIGIPEKKIKTFLTKQVQGFTKKENIECLEYIGLHSFDIRVILSYFRRS